MTDLEPGTFICKRCGGAGDIEVHDQTRGPNGEPFTVECPDCKGTGEFKLSAKDRLLAVLDPNLRIFG